MHCALAGRGNTHAGTQRDSRISLLREPQNLPEGDIPSLQQDFAILLPHLQQHVKQLGHRKAITLWKRDRRNIGQCSASRRTSLVVAEDNDKEFSFFCLCKMIFYYVCLREKSITPHYVINLEKGTSLPSFRHLSTNVSPAQFLPTSPPFPHYPSIILINLTHIKRWINRRERQWHQMINKHCQRG